MFRTIVLEGLMALTVAATARVEAVDQRSATVRECVLAASLTHADWAAGRAKKALVKYEATAREPHQDALTGTN